MVSYSLWDDLHSKPAERGRLGKPQAFPTTTTHRVQRILQLRSELQGLMCLLANRIQYSTLSHPFSPGTSHTMEFQKCLITLFNFKSVFINLFHSFIYFHRQFVIALSKPLTNFFLIAVLVQQFSLTMRWSLLNLSMPALPPRSCVIIVINSPSQDTFSVGRQRKPRLPMIFMSCM